MSFVRKFEPQIGHPLQMVIVGVLKLERRILVVLLPEPVDGLNGKVELWIATKNIFELLQLISRSFVSHFSANQQPGSVVQHYRFSLYQDRDSLFLPIYQRLAKNILKRGVDVFFKG
jgi:hypothetical protein